MGVAGGGLNLCVTDELADHGQAFAYQKTTAGEGVPEVVNSYVLQFGTRAGCGARASADR